MRLTEYLVVIVMIGVFAFLVFQGADDLNKNFPDNQINTTNLTNKYDKIEYIQDQVNDTYTNFQKLGSTDTAWYEKIGAGIVAIPYAVIKFPILVVTAITVLTEMTFNALGFLPSVILLAIVTFLIIEVVRRLLEFFQRSRA